MQQARDVREEFCECLQMKFTLPLGEIQQAGAPAAAAKSVTPCFSTVSDCKRGIHGVGRGSIIEFDIVLSFFL